MKIAYLFQNIETRYTQLRAEQVHVLNTLKGLQGRGHQVDLLALDGRRVMLSGEVEAIKAGRLGDGDFARTSFSGGGAFRLVESGIRRLQTMLGLPYYAIFDSLRYYDTARENLGDYDIIHERYNIPAFGGMLATRKLGIPYVLEMNADLFEQREHKGIPERGLRRRLSLWNTRRCFEQAAKIICTSEVLGDHLKDKWGVAEEKLAVLPCGVDVEAFSRPVDKAAVRRRWGLGEGPIVIWVGGFHIWQDLDLLLESFWRVSGKMPEASLLLVGEGPRKSELVRKAGELGLGEKARFIGAIPHEEVPELLAVADVAANPTPAFLAGRVGAPLKLLEYMAAGRAVVATRLAQIEEVMGDGEDGFLVEAGDVAGFAEAMLQLLGDAGLRQRLGENAARQAAERHSWDHYAERLEVIYRGAIG